MTQGDDRLLRIFFTGANASGSSETLKIRVPLVRTAFELGHWIDNDLESPDIVVCVDFHPRFKQLLIDARRRGALIVLIKQEPPIVYPHHNSPNPLGLFDLVISRGVVEGAVVFNTHQIWEDSFLMSQERISRVAAINANKWSADPRELYSLRRSAYCSDARIDVYGSNWDKGLVWTLGLVAKESLIQLGAKRWPNLRSAKTLFKAPLNIKGPTESKVATLSSYKASLVVENYIGYMSEKLVDSILAGAIPIYVGPSPLLYGIPAELFIHSEPNVNAIKEAISEALDWDHKSFVEAAVEWARAPGVKETWVEGAVDRELIKHIQTSYNRFNRTKEDGIK